MMENKIQWIGIDVSKSMLDVYIRPLKKAQRSSNDPQGIAKLITDLKSLNIELITLEATGGIERLAIEKLQAANLPLNISKRRSLKLFLMP
jgi:transposase